MRPKDPDGLFGRTSRSVSSRHRRQQGTSLVEVVVAAALLGITAVVGLTAWDTALMAAHDATHAAWARCLARSQMEAVLAEPWSDPGSGYQSADPSNISVVVTGSGQEGNTQVVTVTVGPSSDPTYRLVALKSRALAGVHVNKGPIPTGCPPP
jgi:Tfp pilus assembly protein PilV